MYSIQIYIIYMEISPSKKPLLLSQKPRQSFASKKTPTPNVGKPRVVILQTAAENVGNWIGPLRGTTNWMPTMMGSGAQFAANFILGGCAWNFWNGRIISVVHYVMVRFFLDRVGCGTPLKWPKLWLISWGDPNRSHLQVRLFYTYCLHRWGFLQFI